MEDTAKKVRSPGYYSLIYATDEKATAMRNMDLAMLGTDPTEK